MYTSSGEWRVVEGWWGVVEEWWRVVKGWWRVVEGSEHHRLHSGEYPNTAS